MEQSQDDLVHTLSDSLHQFQELIEGMGTDGFDARFQEAAAAVWTASANANDIIKPQLESTSNMKKEVVLSV